MSIFDDFAGLIILDPGEPLSTDGYYFTSINPAIIARLLKVGAVTHRHDQHAAMAAAAGVPTLVTSGVGGSIAANTPLYLGYTLLDADGGETLPVIAPPQSTPAGYAAPADVPVAVADYAAGTLLANTYDYAATVTDGAGGETVISPAMTVVVEPGFPHAEVQISGLTALCNDASGGDAAAGWRLWRSVNGGPRYLIGTGPRATDTFTDGGVAGDCTIQPPDIASTQSTSSFTATVPSAGQPAGAVNFALYLSTDGSFTSPALLGIYPVSDFDTPLTFTDIATSVGAPPPVATTLPGANQIDPDTDIISWPWKRAVATTGALPSVGNTDGDVREVLADHSFHVWESGAWAPWPSGGGAGGDGWTDDTAETWTYASASSFTVPTDLTAKYTLGTYIKLTQGGVVNYFVVTGSSVAAGVTTVKITGGSDYTLANSPITANFHSYMANPQGWPGWFNWSAAPTGFSSITAHLYRFCVVGQMCTFQLTIIGTSNATTLAFTLPIKADRTIMVPGYATDNGVAQTLPASILISGGTTTATVSKDMAGAAWTGAGGKQLTATISYSIASL